MGLEGVWAKEFGGLIYHQINKNMIFKGEILEWEETNDYNRFLKADLKKDKKKELSKETK